MATSPTETLVLSLLADSPQGAFGSELMHKSEGRLKRGSVYALLAKLEKAGFVKGTEIPPTDALLLPRTKYKITAAGTLARQEFAQWTGLALPAVGMACS
ncbi:MAG: PadR family transcriptional regulator [Polaromonas sp.]|nr:PadR family transcriptional regulator [Polaromonas sp.]